jgi:hypothetical protein
MGNPDEEHSGDARQRYQGYQKDAVSNPQRQRHDGNTFTTGRMLLHKLEKFFFSPFCPSPVTSWW